MTKLPYPQSKLALVLVIVMTVSLCACVASMVYFHFSLPEALGVYLLTAVILALGTTYYGVRQSYGVLLSLLGCSVALLIGLVLAV